MSAKSWKFIVYETDDSTVDFTITNSQLVKAPSIPAPRINVLDATLESVSFNIEVGDFSGFVATEQMDSDDRLHLVGRLVEAQIDTGSGFSTVWKGRWVGSEESEGPGKFSCRLSDEQWKARQRGIYLTQDTTQIYPNLPFGLKSGWGLQEDFASWGPPVFRAPEPVPAKVVSVTNNAVVLKLWTKPGAERVSNSLVDWLKDDIKENVDYNTNSTAGNFEHLRCEVTDGGSSSDYEIRVFGDPGGTPSTARRPLSVLDEEEPEWPSMVSLVWQTSQPSAGEFVRLAFHADDALTTETLPYHIGGVNGIDPIQHVKDLYDAAEIRYDSNVFSTYDASTNPDGLLGHPLIPKMWWRITEPKKLADWVSENVYKPLGIVPLLNSDGEIAPRFIFMPQNEDPNNYTTVDSTNVASGGHPTWRHEGTSSITAIKVTYSSGRLADYKQQGDYAADLIEVSEDETDKETNDRESTVGDREHTIFLSGVWSGDRARNLKQHLSREIFDRYGDGPVTGSFKGLSTLESVNVGDFVVIDLDTFPNPTQVDGRGGTRIVQIINKTYTPAGPDFEFLDAGPDAQALSQPSVSVTKNTSSPKEAVDIAVSSLDADATQWTLQLKKGSGDWETYGVFDVGTTSTTIYNLPSGTQITGRVRVSAPLRIRSDWSATNSATLDGLTAPSSLSASVDGRTITLTWSNGESDVAVMPVIMEGTSGTPDDDLKKPLPAGTTEWVFAGLSASTQHTVGVYHFDEETGSESSQTTVTATTGTANTLAEPRRMVVLQGRGTNTPTALAIQENAVGTGIEVGFQPTETHAQILVQVATDSGFTSIVDEITLPPGATKVQLRSLDLGTTYYARAAHIREGWTDSGWTAVVSAQATHLLAQTPREDNLAAGSVRLYEESGTLKVFIDSDDKDTDRVYHEAVKNPGSNPYPTVDTTDNETTRANLPYDNDALDSGGSTISVSVGDVAYITVGFYNDTYGFGSFVRDRLQLDEGVIAPIIQEDPTSTNFVGTLDLTIEDPQLRVTAVEFQKKTAAGDYGGTWLNSWDSSTGTAGTDSTLTRSEDISMTRKHMVHIKYRVQWTDQNGTTQTIGGNVPFDIDKDPEVLSGTISFASDGDPIICVEGDDDCDSIEINVGINSDPGAAVSANGEYSVSGRSGCVQATSDNADMGDEVYARAWGKTGSVLGVTKLFRKIRGDTHKTKPRFHYRGFRSGTSATFEVDVDDPTGSLTAMEYREREGDGTTSGWTSWSPTTGSIGGTNPTFDHTITIDAGQDSQFEWRATWTDENGTSRTVSAAPVQLSNMEDGGGAVDFHHASFRGGDDGTNDQYDTSIGGGSTKGYIYANPADGQSDFYGVVALPPGVTIDRWEAEYYLASGDDSITAIFKKSTSSGETSVDTLSVSGGAGSWATYSQPLSETTSDDEPYYVYLSLSPGSNAATDARFRRFRFEYTRPTFDKVL